MKRKFIFLAVLATIFLCACSNQEDFLVRGEVNVDQQVGLQTDDVTASDIGMVVSEFFGGQRTRGVDYDTSVITDASGNAAIYVVNYKDNQGFLLISATKRYCPVLAYADKGNFDVSGIGGSGLVDWHAETLSAIELAKQLPDDSIQKFRSMWQRYEQPQTSKALKARKRSASDPDVMRAQTILQDSVSAWIAKGYTIFDITEENPYAEEVKGAIYPLYEEEWERLSIGVNKKIIKNEIVPNLLCTEWCQSEAGFNQSFPKLDNGKLAAVGCGPLAAGQIMYYHKYPQRFNWADMPIEEGTKTTSDFLLEIAQKSKAEYRIDYEKKPVTTTIISNVCSVLNDFGYTEAYVGEYDMGKVLADLRNSRPVYMRAGAGMLVGHAWVVSGAQLLNEYDYSEIYTFKTKQNFEPLVRYGVQNYSYSYLYMNWGYFEGKNNGYYISNEMVTDKGVKLNAQNRENIYNIYPTK